MEAKSHNVRTKCSWWWLGTCDKGPGRDTDVTATALLGREAPRPRVLPLGRQGPAALTFLGEGVAPTPGLALWDFSVPPS